MIAFLAALTCLAATLFALVAITVTVQGSWSRIVAALAMGSPNARVQPSNVVRVRRAIRPAALPRFAPRALTAAA